MKADPRNPEVLFNLHDVFEVEIEPLMKKLQRACKKYDFPFVCGVCYGQNEDGSLIATMGYEVAGRDPLIFRIFSRLVDRPDITKLLAVSLLRLTSKKPKPSKILRSGS